MKHLLVLSLSVFAWLGLARQDPDSSAATTMVEREHPLAWLVGRWVGEGFGGDIEEAWLPSSGGAMLGTFRLVTEGRPSFYELMTIEDRADGPVMQLKHFDPDLSSWEKQDEARVWPGEEIEEGRVRFGPVEYVRDGADRLTVRVEVSTGEKSEVHELGFRRAK